MNKILGKVLKFAFAAGIIGYLFYNAAQNDQFTTLLREPKDWPRIGLAFGLFFSGVCFTFFRWQLLVRALDFSFSTSKAFSLGFLGYLFNFVAPGGVGGDLFKAVFIAREYHGRRAQAVATVVIDRIVGLYGLFVVASGAVLINGLWKSPSASVRGVAYGTLLGTLIGAIGILMLLIPGSTNGRFSEFLGNLPRIGSVFRQLIGAVRMYRTRLGSVGFGHQRVRSSADGVRFLCRRHGHSRCESDTSGTFCDRAVGDGRQRRADHARRIGNFRAFDRRVVRHDVGDAGLRIARPARLTGLSHYHNHHRNDRRRCLCRNATRGVRGNARSRGGSDRG